MTGRKAAISAIAAGFVFAVGAFAAEWPQWRGPNRDGVWREEGTIKKFDSPQLQIRWRAKIANGYSGPTVANGRVYITDRLTTPTEVERVHCFNAMTGEEIWSYPYECKYEKVAYRDGPRVAVTIDGNRAYSLGTMGHFFCFDAAKGTVIWNKNLNSEYQIKMPMWGIAAAPVVENDLVIVQMGERGDPPNTNNFQGLIDEVRIYNRALSWAEIEYLAGKPMIDINKDGSVDFRDYTILADMWLEELLWPQ